MEMDSVRDNVQRASASDAKENAVEQQPVASSSKLPDEPRISKPDTNEGDREDNLVLDYTDEDYQYERAELEQCRSHQAPDSNVYELNLVSTDNR